MLEENEVGIHSVPLDYDAEEVEKAAFDVS
jgi:hypothetical protein